jgi:putative ABC transport system permease protein
MRNLFPLAVKNVFRSRKRSVTLGANYAIVSFILVALFAFARGASTNVSTSIVRASAGHITISGQYAKDGRIYGGLERVPEIEAIAARTLGPGATTLPRYLLMSMVYNKGLSKRLNFTGIDSTTDTGFRGQMKFSSGSWEAWAAEPNGVALPADIASYFGIALGDELVVSARTRFGAFNTGILKVSGVYSSDNYFMGGLVLVHLPFLRSLDLAGADSATNMYVYLPSTAGLTAKRAALSDALAAAGFEVSRPTSDTEAIAAVSAASVKYEVDKEGRDREMLKLSTIDEVLGIVRSILGAVSAVGALVAAIMLFVIAVSIFINLRMSVNERLREIGTMRAIGVDASSVTSLFVMESAGLALVSAGIGAVLGALACLAFRYAVPMPPDPNLSIFLSSDRLVLEPNLGDMAALVAAITVFAAAFSFFPARRGGRIRPVEALNSTF